MADSLGEYVAKNDLTIKESIQNIVEKENNIMQQYEQLQKFAPHCSINMQNDLANLLEERRIFLTYKMQSKKDQSEALFKLLEYLNILENKQKKMDIQSVLDKMNILESEILPYEKVLLI